MTRNQRVILETKYGPLICQHYEIGRAIGEGTFGKVRLGIHKLSGIQVAIKILIKKKIIDVSDIERVSREITILKKIRHINIIRLYEVIDTSKYIFLIMEYANNGEVFDYIVNKTRLSESEGCKFLHMIINGIDYCHKNGIIHRDLKPENLLLNKFNEIKIVDFGLGQIINQKDKLLSTACGSPCYAAPEMIAGKPYKGSSADIWSIGIILYALLCGYLPFEHPNTNILYKKIIKGHFEIPSWISNSAKSLLHKILNTDPTKRYSINDIRKHPWYKQQSVLSDPLPIFIACNNSPRPIVDQERNHIDIDIKLDQNIISQMKLIGYDIDKLLLSIKERKHDHYYATYQLLKLRETNNNNNNNNNNTSNQQKPAMIDKILLKIKQKQKLSNKENTPNQAGNMNTMQSAAKMLQQYNFKNVLKKSINSKIASNQNSDSHRYHNHYKADNIRYKKKIRPSSAHSNKKKKQKDSKYYYPLNIKSSPKTAIKLNKKSNPQKLLNHHLIEKFVSNNNAKNGKPDIPKLNLSVVQKWK